MDSDSLSRRRFLLGSGVGLGTLFVGTGTAAAEPRDRYIVGTGTPSATGAAKRAAHSVHHELDFGDLGSAVAGTFPEAALDGLRKRPDVRYVERDGLMQAISIDSSDSEVPWGVDRVDAEKSHAAGSTGSGASIAILDTGIDSNHPDLEANLGTGTALVSARGPYDEPWDDDNGHGTHCAGTAGAIDDGSGVVGVSTAATLHAVKVLDKDGSGYYSDVAAGLEWVANQGLDVASLSLGGPKSRTIEDACQYAFDRGVLIVAAAGNDGSDVENSAPATYPTVMAISATDDGDSLASWSNTGSDIELAAPGVNIYSTYPGGGYRRLSGTSMACPHVSGAAGQLIAQGNSRDDARTKLHESAEDIGLSSDQQGYGLLDVEAALSGSTDGAPSVSWHDPTGGETLSGSLTLQIAASDAEDATGSLIVEYQVDGGSWQPASYNTETGYYEETIDTTALEDGGHTLDASVTDSAGTTSTASISVTTENTDDAPTVSWVSPENSATLSDSVTLQIAANDDQTSPENLIVEYELDDSGAWNTATYNADTGYHEASLDTTALADGDHTLDARASDGTNTSSDRVSVTVDNSTTTPSSPTTSIGSISEANSRNPHAEFTVPWSAGDENGDLDTVELRLTQTAPRTATEDVVTLDVSGASASGQTELTAKHDDGSGNTYEVTLTVTDATGRSDSVTVSPVTEDGR